MIDTEDLQRVVASLIVDTKWRYGPAADRASGASVRSRAIDASHEPFYGESDSLIESERCMWAPLAKERQRLG